MKKLGSGRILVALIVLVALAAAAAYVSREPIVDRARVESIVSFLSADAMRGRRAFTPEAVAAAEFIAAQFDAIGLEPWAGAEGFLQRFPVYSLTVESRAVMLNGHPVPEDRVAFSLAAEALDWTTGDEIEVVIVGPDKNPMQAFQAARRSETDTLIVVSSEHEELFTRVRGFLSRPSRTLERGTGTSMVMVLADPDEVTSYRVEVTGLLQEEELVNVIGVIPGRRTDEIVLFSAHYDHIGVVAPVDGDAIANGANDDASGTTAVIELARYFEAKWKPERTLMFVAFTAEEMGGYGSRYFSSHSDPDQIVAMFNIEMIGKPAAEGPNTAWVTGFDKSDFGQILQAATADAEYTFMADPYPMQNLFYRSDNTTLARLGVPAHSISTTPIDVDPDYHQVSDEVETLDLDHMTKTIQAIARAAGAIISGDATPTRVDSATVN